MYIKYLTLFLFFSISLSSCIKDDIPYPKEVLYIKDISFSDQEGKVKINNESFSIDVNISENADLKKIKLTSLECTDGSTSNIKVGDIINLDSTNSILLSKYQKYVWQIYAKQKISRVFSVKGQIGEPIFSPDIHKAIVFVSPNTPLDKINIDSIKLEKSAYNISKESKERLLGKDVDFTKSQKILLVSGDKKIEWTLIVLHSKEVVRTTAADGLVRVAYLYGEAGQQGNVGFEYKLYNSNTWIKVPSDDINRNGSRFSAVVKGLMPSSKYVCRATYETYLGKEIVFNTIEEQVIPDGSFDNWYTNGSDLVTWEKGGTHYWDSSNTPGGNNVSYGSTIPEGLSDGKSVKLSSKSVFGVFASASIYLGAYIRKDGLTNVVLSFGREYTSMPTRFEGYYKFKSSSISYAYDKYTNLKGRPDSCFIYALLTDRRSPLEIRTNSSNRQLVDFNAKYIIASATLTKGSNVDKWTKFSIPFEYRRTNKRPTQLILVVSSSKYGDYFTGGTGTELDIDNFEFKFD